MKILQVHNRYRQRGGEDAVLENTVAALKRQGHLVSTLERHSGEVSGVANKINAVFTSIWSKEARAAMFDVLDAERPDVVHVHNLYPLLSPSVLDACRVRDVPVVMTCHNYRLTCPIGVHFREGAICECCRRHGEHWCVIRNCRDNRVESVAYAIRNFITRQQNMFEKNIARFICISEFLRDYLVSAGFPESKFSVVPNMVRLPETVANPANGTYIAFLGRFVPEKGIGTLIEAAKLVPHIPVWLAGAGPLEDELRASAPANVHFKGMMNAGELSMFYMNARATVVPSVWYETFGLVAAEAMSYGVPPIISNIGGLAEVVDHNETGLKFPAGDARALAEAMDHLWSRPEHARYLGAAGRDQVAREYNEARYVERLLEVYERAINDTAVRAA